MSRSVQLGLYVVGRLAQRYGVRVALKNSAYGGTTAVVLIPGDLLIQEDGVEAAPAGSRGAGVAAPAAAGVVPVAARAAIGSGGAERAPIRPEDGDAVRTETLTAPTSRTENAGPEPGAAQPATAESGGAGAESGKPADGKPADGMPRTPAGLPFRIPQASLNPALRTGPLTGDGQSGDGGPGDRQAGGGQTADGRVVDGLVIDGQAGGGRPAGGQTSGQATDDERRSPEEVRKLVGSYLSGTSRGRSDAARARRAGTDPRKRDNE